MEASVKFRVNWSIQQDKWLPVMKRWELDVHRRSGRMNSPAGGRLLGPPGMI